MLVIIVVVAIGALWYVLAPLVSTIGGMKQ